MDIFLWIVFLLWVLGWINELAYVDAKTKQHNIDYPNKQVKYMSLLVLFFTWPYFYFYGRAIRK